ncbi:MAG: glycosyltransferase, partial [Dysgonamonadaceae bacterium]|nr:glycosyltransferase [Dysgonamonadaceae bacterium]
MKKKDQTVVKVSVILPNYNHARFLEQRIQSIVDQTFQEFELIILDDCSTDDSRGIIENYRDNPKVSQIIYNEQNSGSTFKQWIKGINAAKGEYIWLAESDDWAENDFL